MVSIDTVDAIIVAENVHKTYAAEGQPVHALQGVTLAVQRGEMVSIMGPLGLREDNAAELPVGA